MKVRHAAAAEDGVTSVTSINPEQHSKNRKSSVRFSGG